MTETILEILKQLGIYTEARKHFDSDEDLAGMFNDNFDELAAMFMNP